MKIACILLLITSLQVSAGSYGQTVTLSESNASIEKVISKIKAQTGYSFWYRSDVLQNSKPVNINITNAPLADALALLFKDQPIAFNITDKTVFLVKKSKSEFVPASKNVVSIDIKGKVTNEKGEPVIASVTVKETGQSTSTNEAGEFILKAVDENATLVVSSINIETREIKIAGKSDIAIFVRTRITEGLAVTVTGSTGYQSIPKVTSVGSFSVASNKLLNRSVSTNILNRIENVLPGVLFNKGEAGNPDALLVRGRSTLFANAAPLIVLDNFPYDGDLSNINPNDVETVTILKDAAAASIWGARAGNGVIVITTKRGKTAKPKIELNTNVTFQKRPDLNNVNTISSSDYIDLEKFLFEKKRYASDELFNNINLGHPAFTPVVELLIAKRDGLISAAEADAQIEAMKNYDVRNDVSKYFYRTAINQQYAFNVSANTSNINYYLSGGYDRNLPNLEGQQMERITLRSQNTFKISDRLQVSGGLNYLQTINKSGNNPGWGNFRGKGYLYPYAQLMDDNGNSQPVYTEIRKKFAQASEQKGLLNWEYNPITDLHDLDYTGKTRDFLVNAGIKYVIFPFLNAEVKYQYENQLGSANYWNKENSFFARNLINNYTQVGTTGALTLPIPKGGILDVNNSDLTSHQGRAQLNFSKHVGSKHDIDAIAGYEIRSVIISGNNYRMYGYNPDKNVVGTQVDFVTRFKSYNNTFATDLIPNPQSVSKKTDHFLSYYANASYTYDTRYIVTVSGRKDEANLFGVKANQKGTPLWSIGGAWVLTNEKFYNFPTLSYVKLRGSFGYNGNISRLASAFTTARYRTSSVYPLSLLDIVTPPNEKLTWEKIRMINLGLDFESKNKVVTGSIEFYEKRSSNLLGQAPVDPTYGLSSQQNLLSFFYGNVAGIKGKGVDIEITTHNIDKLIKWSTDFIYSYSSNKVTKYLMPLSTSGNAYLSSSSTINPVKGNPLFSVYSFQWRGLDTAGNPVGVYGKENSTNWNSIYGKTPLDSLVFHGSAQPTSFGAIRNTISWKNLSLSFNISYKFGYYFRKQVLSYGNLFGAWSGHGEYADRWQKPGDEAQTNVPSLVYPANPNRDLFYQYASINVLKGDHIRLEDVSISYDLNNTHLKKMPFSNVRLYFYAQNLGVLWKANKEDIDPYFNNVVKPAKSFSFGANFNF